MICRIHRAHINAAIDSNRALPAGTQIHCDACPTCRSYFEEHSQLADKMRETGYEGIPAEMPAYLATRIRAHLTGAQSTDRKSWIETLVRPASISIGVAIVFLVVGGLAMRNRWSGGEADPIPTVAVSTAPFDPAPTNPMPEVIRPLLGHFASNPLETEARLLASDTEDALRFLASNFVPSENRKQSRL
jgi:hypothetical protein